MSDRLLDPFQLTCYARTHGPARLNPLDSVAPDGPNLYEQCNSIAEVVMPKRDRESFFYKQGRGIFRGFLVYICTAPEFNDPGNDPYYPELRSITTVNKLFKLPVGELLTYVRKISAADFIPFEYKEAANKILNSSASKKMLVSITETLSANIQILNSPNINRSLSASDFRIADILNTPFTLYIVLPTDKIDEYKAWINLIVNILIKGAIKQRGKPLPIMVRPTRLYSCLMSLPTWDE